jgi:hypothetical protein
MPPIIKEIERRHAALQVAIARLGRTPEETRASVEAEIRAEREVIALMAALRGSTKESTVKYSIEKAIVAAMEPLVDDIVQLERQVAILQSRLAALESASAPQASGTASPIALALERNRARA